MTQEMKRQVFFAFLAMTRAQNNKNNTSYAMMLALTECSKGTLLKSQSTMSYFGLQVSATTVINHSSCCAKHLKTIRVQNTLKDHYLWLCYENTQVVLKHKLQREGKSSFSLKATSRNAKVIIHLLMLNSIKKSH